MEGAYSFSLWVLIFYKLLRGGPYGHLSSGFAPRHLPNVYWNKDWDNSRILFLLTSVSTFLLFYEKNQNRGCLGLSASWKIAEARKGDKIYLKIWAFHGNAREASNAKMATPITFLFLKPKFWKLVFLKAQKNLKS